MTQYLVAYAFISDGGLIVGRIFVDQSGGWTESKIKKLEEKIQKSRRLVNSVVVIAITPLYTIPDPNDENKKIYDLS